MGSRLLSKFEAPLRKRQLQLLGYGDGCRRWLEGIVQPDPQVTVDEQLLAQQGHQIRQGPAEGSPELQIFDQQHGNQRRPDLDFQGVRGSPHEGLHPQILFERLEKQLSGKGLARC